MNRKQYLSENMCGGWAQISSYHKWRKESEKWGIVGCVDGAEYGLSQPETLT